MSQKPLRTAIIGTGFVGRVHLEAVRRLGFVEVAAVVDQALTPAAADAMGVKTATYDEVLADKSIVAVDICTPNALHAPMAKRALEAGKNVLCEKPLATSAAAAAELVAIAKAKNLKTCTCHNLRYYPMVQQMRRMREAGELGDILIVQGTYSQDWLLYDTDYSWRIEVADNGPSRCVADIGSHFCDMAEHVTGQRITRVCADLQTFYKTRRKPKGPIDTFSGKTLKAEDYTPYPVNTEDMASVIFRMGDRTRGAYVVSQASAGRKNRLSIEIYGTKCGVAWDGETPNQLWIGHRNKPNELLIKDPSLLTGDARTFADLPGGHGEGYGDTFKQVFRRFYHSLQDANAPIEYPQFADGLRQLTILEAELASSQREGWVDVPSV